MASSPRRSIDVFLPRVLGSQFSGPSFAAWRAVLRATFALPLDAHDFAIYQQVTGRTQRPTTPARELWCVCGRRAGKSLMAAIAAVFLTTCRSYVLAAGERGVFMVIAADRRQARVVRRYIGGLLESTPVLAQLVAHETKDSIELTNGITIEIHTASFRTVRGYTLIGCVLDELAFWPTDDSADPDREVIAALRPAMATVPDAMLIALSSPYAKKGELYRMHREHYGVDGDPVLVVQAPTRVMNPSVPQHVVDAAYANDPVSANSEFGAEFRPDISTFIAAEAVDAVVVPGRFELPPVPGVRYHAFLDFSGGSGGDSATLAVAHAEPRRTNNQLLVLDALREIRPPFSPEQVCADFATTLRAYGIRTATSDRWGGQFPVEQMRKHGIEVSPSAAAKSDLYRELLPLINSGSDRVELLDLPRLRAQLQGLERRTARGGRDSIDHAPGQTSHDDLANACAGALVMASTPVAESWVGSTTFR